MYKILKNNIITTLIISCIIVMILFGCSSFFRVLNKSVQNQYYEIKNNIVGLQASPHIIIVELDEKSFSEIGTFPFPRDVYATFLENLAPLSVATIAFDILFLDPSTPEMDQIFSSAISASPNVVLGSSISNDSSVLTPFSGLDQDSYQTGFLPPNIDDANNTVYSFTPKIVSSNQESYEHFSLKILRSFYDYYGINSSDDMGDYGNANYVFSPNISFPLASDDSREILINFIPPEKFTSVSFSDIYDAQTLEYISQEIDFTDAIILIGATADGLKDEFFTPNGNEYGVYIHANILNTLLQKQYITYFDRQLEWVLIFLLLLLSVYANLSPSSRVLLISNFLIILIFWFVFPISILLGTNLIINFPAEIIFSLLLAFAGANIVKYLIEDSNKQKLNKALSEYVGSNIADEILLEHGKVNLDGQEKDLVCFFSDIQGFTKLSEKVSPRELVTFLREYLSVTTEIIMDTNGHVDKFEGDAVMALWGAFTQHSEKDYIFACQAALRQRERLSELNEKWMKKFSSPIETRIGIHGGSAIIGNIGAIGRKMEFTALGDNVNLASRLEGVNKYYGTYICVSEVVYRACKESFCFRYLDEIQVQGKDIPVKIYELIGELGSCSKEMLRMHDDFSQAIDLYKQQNFTDACKIFSRLYEQGDQASKSYMDRCLQYQKKPPQSPWDGVYRMTEK